MTAADSPTCPICRRKMPNASRALTPTYPFCSPRCKLVDLGNWLDNRYVVPGGPPENLDDLDDEALAALLEEPS
jgi:endogenous inhibitor of DNA gyrase (YacG/DUF329 family)